MDETLFCELLENDSLKTGVCRLCLRYNESFFSVHSASQGPYGDCMSVLDLLTANSIQITSGDGLPEVICKMCLDSAVHALQFKMKCAESIATLVRYFKKYQNDYKISEIYDDVDYLPVFPKNEIIILETYDDIDACFETKDVIKEKIREVDNYSDTKKYLNNSKVDLSSKIACAAAELNLKGEVSLNAVNVLDNRKPDPNSFKCPQCPLSFLKMQDLQKHMVTGLHQLECKVCHKVYQTKKGLRGHFQLKHMKPKEKHCRDCNAVIKGDMHLTGQFKYQCNICGQKYPCPKYLNSHIQYVHVEKLNTLIPIDNVVVKKRLKDYAKPPHKLFICDYCGASRTTKYSLIGHINIHLGIKPHRCDICKKYFTSKNRMQGHRRIHTEEKKIQCDICGMKLATKMSFTYHRRIHTGEKPFPCEHCDLSFLSSSRRLDHVRKKHLPKVECPDCSKMYTPHGIKRHMAHIHYGFKRKKKGDSKMNITNIDYSQ